MAKFKIISHLYFPTTLFQQINLWFMQKKWQSRWEKEKREFTPQANLSSRTYFSIFRENEIFEFLSAFRLHSILQQQKSQMCVRVCDRRKLKKPVEKSAPHPNAYANGKSREKKTKRKFKCEMWEENGSEQESARKKLGGMKSDSFFFWNERKKQL